MTPPAQAKFVPSNFVFTAVLAALYLRLIVGAMGIGGLAPLATLGLAGVTVAAFLYRPVVARSTIWITLGLAIWAAVAVLSWTANAPLMRQDLATTQLALLITYAFLMNTLEVYGQSSQATVRLEQFLRVFIIFGFVLSLYQVASGSGFVEAGRSTYKRAFGSDVHPVSFSLQLVIALVGLEIARIKQGVKFGRIHWIIFAMAIVALFLTYSRTGWLIFVIIFVSAGILHLRPIVRVIFAPFVFIGLVVVAVMSERFDDLTTLRFFFENYDFQSGVFDHRFVDNSLSWRIANWSIGLKNIAEQPWLGYGPGQAVAVSQFELQMHNLFMEVLVEVGMLGFLPSVCVVMGVGFIPLNIRENTSANLALRRLWRLLAFALFLNIMISNSLIGQTMTIVLLIISRVLLGAVWPETKTTKAPLVEQRIG